MVKQVQARFRVHTHTRYHGFNEAVLDEFTLSGVQGEPFGPATPSATQKLVVANPEAAALLITAFETKSTVDVFYSLTPPPAPDPVEQPTPVEDGHNA